MPFTIPLSWFYLGFSAYLLAYMGLVGLGRLRECGANAFGSLCLLPGILLRSGYEPNYYAILGLGSARHFFGMPYQNFAGWFGTGAVFMAIATLLWQLKPLSFSRVSLGLPLAVYLSNLAFATVIGLDSGIYFPILLGLLLGVLPALLLYRSAVEAEITAHEDNDTETSSQRLRQTLIS